MLLENLRGCSIFFIGMMGSGKSTAGRMLANSLKYAYFDTDTVIEMAHKDMTVADIFKVRAARLLDRQHEAQGNTLSDITRALDIPFMLCFHPFHSF